MNNAKYRREKWEEEFLHPAAKKSIQATRWKEDSANDYYQTRYQQDITTILFSDAFRRLRMKTQVFVASGLDQHKRTRLTHTLEVANIAEIIARAINVNSDLTRAIALGHDLGHTPFGHAGERALDCCMKKYFQSSFHHNVQSVYVVRNKRGGYNLCDDSYPGFNLTHDVVEGIWKHTKHEETVGEIDHLEDYYPELPASLEGQIVHIADGIAYLRHDIEDGASSSLFDYKEFRRHWESEVGHFDERNWFYYFVDDVIKSFLGEDGSKDTVIKYSQPVQSLYDGIKNVVKTNILQSEQIKKHDENCQEAIKKIFEYYYHNSKELENKANNAKLINEGFLGRAIVNYIQWLGDENAKVEFTKLTGKNFDKYFGLK